MWEDERAVNKHSARTASLHGRRALFCALLLFLVGGAGQGCDKKKAPAARLSKTKRALLKTPASELLPLRKGKDKARLRFPSSGVAEIRITLKKSSVTPKRFRLFRAEKQWWLLQRLPEGRHRLALFTTFSVQRWLGAPFGIRSLAPAQGRTPVVEDEIVLNGRRGRFLLRLMRLALKQPDGNWAGGSWQLYQQGHLFQQPPEGSLTRSLRRLLASVKQLARKGRWLELPLRSWGWNNASLLRVGGALAAHRQALKSCFKKRTFPAHVGTLKIQLEFAPDGKVKKKKMRLKTRAHVKYGLVWCIWNQAKGWTLQPPVPEFRYLLRIPPAGP